MDAEKETRKKGAKRSNFISEEVPQEAPKLCTVKRFYYYVNGRSVLVCVRVLSSNVNKCAHDIHIKLQMKILSSFVTIRIQTKIDA